MKTVFIGNCLLSITLSSYAISTLYAIVLDQDSVCQVAVEHGKQNSNDTLDGGAGVQSGADSVCFHPCSICWIEHICPGPANNWQRENMCCPSKPCLHY